eukprot:m.483168 g.483168  ORF g.483168 m.483168 type:complete len:397 (+) comp21723_c0_seq54:316-1506(+)
MMDSPAYFCSVLLAVLYLVTNGTSEVSYDTDSFDEGCTVDGTGDTGGANKYDATPNYNLSVFEHNHLYTHTSGSAYLLFCPCQGRFGNQMDYFLGALALAKRTDRTLVVPPFIFYGPHGRVTLKSFDHIYNLSALALYHPKVISMHDFMHVLAPTVWPPKSRVAHCGMSRAACDAKTGNPRETFWDHFGVEFAHDSQAPVSYASPITMWEQFWSHKKHPVVALASTPGPFPVTDPTILALQRYFVWIEPLQQQHLSGVQSMLADSEHTTWVAAHVRAGRDWQLACEKGQGHRKFFSSQQCTLPTGAVTREVCLPTMEEYVDTLVTVAARAGTDVIYIGTDSPAAHSALVAAAAARGAALRFFTSADVHPGATQVNAVLTDQHMFSVCHCTLPRMGT